MSAEGLQAAEEKMRSQDVPDVFVDTFRNYYEQLEEGDSGLLPDAELETVDEIQSADDLPSDPEAESEALGRAVVIKLNGGLGTSMGMSAPKSLLPVKEGLSFVDIVARQTVALRREHDARLPLALMNSFSTREESIAALERHEELSDQDVPLDFVQHKGPKLLADDLTPASWPDDPDLEWAPPGHGDLYTALVTSGMLERLLAADYEYAFVANIDNLGAVLDPRILAWFASQELPFLMEVADRTEADRKGGHLAARQDGGLVLREIAQAPEDDVDSFQDTSRWRFFNTNTMWVNLRSLDEVLRERDGVLGLPIIVNHKTVDPTDSSSPKVVQVETAMGAAIAVFEGAQALRVPRERFAPVKTTNDLLGLRSDAYVLREECHVVANPERTHTSLYVDLDPDHFKLIDDFDARFPEGPPSLVDCERFVVKGDVRFGEGVVAHGCVEVEASEGEDQLVVEDGTELSG
ncbi:MAG: UTP--glucose-1-phosphate uridylyltransferase [Solirubrobacteraceae bacterium]